MADKCISPKLAALRGLEASLRLHRSAEAARANAPDDAHRSPPLRHASWRGRWRTSRAHSLLRGAGMSLNGAVNAVVGLWRRSARPWLRHRMPLLPRAALSARERLRSCPRYPAVGLLCKRTVSLLRLPIVRRLAKWGAVAVALFAAIVAGLWWRLTSGPIAVDFATPWLTAAIAENLGSRYQVQVGGTVIELDENRRMALRIRDIVVRDSDGAVVASAPKAEAGFAGMSLLTGSPRAESLNLVGAELALRIETDGKITVFAGGDKRPLATSPVLASAAPAPSESRLRSEASPDGPAAPTAMNSFAALLGWADGLGTFGFASRDLTEVGLKSGNLIVDDLRNGRQSKFENIHLSITRPKAGEVTFSVGSEDPDRPWLLLAAIKPTGERTRAVRLEARKLSLRDLLMALRVDEGQWEADVPMSASLRAEIGRDGTPQYASGRILIGPGVVGEIGDPTSRIAIDRIEASLEWDSVRRTLAAPFQVLAGGARATLVAQAEAPREPGGPWALGLRGGTIVLAPYAPEDEALLLNRIMMRARFDPAKRRIDIEHADFGGVDVGFAMSGNVDFSGSDPRLAIGIAAGNMSAASFKQLWPSFVSPPVRSWVLENMSGGSVERLEIATNAPWSTLKAGGPPVPDDGLSIEVVTSGTVVRAVESLPLIRDADLVTRIRGRNVTVSLGRGTVNLPSGRKLTLANGMFEVPDTFGKSPPARVRARIDGPVPAAAELLAMERLRDISGAPLDPAASRGTVSAQMALAMRMDPNMAKGTVNYNIVADVANLAIDRFAMSQRVEAQSLRITANNDGYQAKGDVRIGGTPAAVEYRKNKGEGDAEVRLQATFDDAARSRFGFSLYGAVTGPIPIKLGGRIASAADQDNRFAVEADLTQAKIDNLLPSWVKPAGKPARTSFTYIGKGNAARYEDFVVEGSGSVVKGTIEVDPNGDIASASFPVFGLSDGDKASLKAERGPDGVLKIGLRGDVYDGRSFIKSTLGGSAADPKQRHAVTDFDLDVKMGALAGFNGEALRGLDMKLARRGGHIQQLALNAKIGVDTPLIGDLRGRQGGGNVVYFETNDAGALFRFTDIYARMIGGQMWVAMDPPSLDQAPQEGLLNIRDFGVRGERALEGVAGNAAGGANRGIEFTRMRVEFTRSPGRLTLRDGVVRGPAIGATIEGRIDYASNEVRMRGTFVPLYGLNNAFGQIPIVGLFLGGSNEGLVGITYEVVGTPGAPVLHVNPISAVAPGLLRKLFEFPSTVGVERFPDVSR